MTTARPTKLIFCEGPADRAFFERLIAAWDIQPFCIEVAEGNGHFYKSFDAFDLKGKGFKPFTDMLVVADYDDSPNESFKQVCDQIRKKFGDKAAPKKVLERVPRGQQRPSITVMMMPDAAEAPTQPSKGHLETLCLPAAKSVESKTTSNVEQFLATMRTDQWTSEPRRDKAWLRSHLAVTADNPFVSLKNVFDESKNRDLIPIRHKSFEPLANYLKVF